MPPEPDIHTDVAAHLLGSLTQREQRRFEDHLQECESCRREAAELRTTADAFDAAREVRDAVVPSGMSERVMAAVARAAAADEGADPNPEPEVAAGPEHTAPAADAAAQRRSRPPLLERLFGSAAGAIAAAACAVIVLVIGGSWLLMDGDDSGADGNLEVAGTMVAPAGLDGTADVEVVETGIGREIDFNSDNLPILPTGEYYELWFVGPGDTPESPNRISAGTFHPDADGVSELNLKAAVDPAKFPVLEVTAEPGDGDPAVNGDVVLKLDSRG